MEKGFYAWYEDVFNQCSQLVKGPGVTSSEANVGATVGTLLFSGKFSSLSVVIRMGRPYDFVFSGAWASSFKAFIYRQQNYNHILYELYADQLSSRLIQEHRNLYSFLEGHPLLERSNVNKTLGNRLDQVFKVVLPKDHDSNIWGAVAAKLSVLSIMNGVFSLERQFVLIQGNDTFDAMVECGVKIKVVLEKSYMLGGNLTLVKFAELDSFGIRQFVVVMPYFADIESLPGQVAGFRQEIDAQLRTLEASKMSADFVRPNFAKFIKS